MGVAIADFSSFFFGVGDWRLKNLAKFKAVQSQSRALSGARVALSEWSRGGDYLLWLQTGTVQLLYPLLEERSC